MVFAQKKWLTGFVTIFVFSLASMAIADIFSGSSNTSVSGDTSYVLLTLNKPSDAVTNDILIASLAVDGGTPAEVIAPTGWNLIERTDNDTNISLVSFWKKVESSEPSSYTWTVTQTVAVAGITRYSGLNPANPIDVVSGSTGRSTSATAPSVTTTDANHQVITIVAINAATTSNATFGAPAGTTLKYSRKKAPLGPTIAAYDTLQASAGSSGTKTTTVSANAPRDWAAQQIALRASSIPDPIAYWKFDESSGVAMDSSGNGKTLTNHNATPYISGKIGNAAGFDRASTHYFSRTNGGLNPTAGTVSCWIRRESNPSVLSIMGDGTGLGTGGFSFRVDENDHLDFYFGDDTIEVNGTTSLLPNVWYMASVTWDMNGKEVFLNGVSDGADANPQTLTAGTANFYVGIRGDINEGFDGAIDECGIWDQVLTPEQIEALYNSGTGLSYPF